MQNSILDLDFALSNKLRNDFPPEVVKLADSEQIIWAGRPKQGIFFIKKDLVLIPISIILAVVFLMLGGADLKTNALAKFIDTVIVLSVVAYVLISRVGKDFLKRRKTSYLITTSRVFIKSGFFRKKIDEFPIENVKEIQLERFSDGSGKIIFLPNTLLLSEKFKGYHIHSNQFEVSLNRIQDAGEVHSKILDLMADKV